MRIEVPHQLGREEAIRRIDGGIDNLRNLPIPGGVKMEDLSKTWSGNVLNLSCRIKKFFLGTTLSVQITVGDDRVVIELEPPLMLKSVLADDTWRQAVQNQIVPLLS